MKHLVVGLLLAFSAVAEAWADPVPGSTETVRLAGAVIELRHDGVEPEVVDQVRRVLPGAVQAAGRWGGLQTPVVLTIHPTHERLEAAVRARGRPWMRAWARRDAVDVQSPSTWSRGYASDEALGQVLAHELTHCVLFRSMGARWENRDVPFWFEEGMATVAAGERHARASAEAVEAPARLVRTDPKLAYGTADRAFRLLVARHGDEGVRRLVVALSEGRPFSVAFGDAMGTPLAGFERDLRVELTALAARD